MSMSLTLVNRQVALGIGLRCCVATDAAPPGERRGTAILSMFLIYSLLFTLGVVLTAPYYLWRLRGHILSDAGWRERLGYLPESFQQPDSTRQPSARKVAKSGTSPALSGAVWIHTVSVGETLAVAALVQELHRRYPERKIFMSHVTPAGREAGEKRLPSVVTSAFRAALDDRNQGGAAGFTPSAVAGRFFLPLDWSFCVKRVLERIRPAILIIVETELWPNLLRSTHRWGARVVLVNARLSDESFRGYMRFKSFIQRMLENIDAVYAQTSRDAERFCTLRIPAERVMVAGNLKFDGAPPTFGELPGVLNRGFETAGRNPILVAGSTMPGEEPLVLEAWERIRSRYPQALLILAPRHPARFREVSQLLREEGLPFVRRTMLEADESQMTAQLREPQILLLDSIGELGGIFQLADVVFIGGSLVPTGGHNLLEPAYWGKPILFGPHMHNFHDIARMFLESRGAMQVSSASDLAEEACRLLSDVWLRRQLGQRAKQVLQSESGATQRILQQLDHWLS
jgi:3-deoxy-D-manno-octulosonic-acid transferase